MRKMKSSMFVLLILLLTAYAPLAMAHPQNTPTPDTFVIDTIYEPETLDPAWANDPASDEVIMNVYETLLFFDRDYTKGPYATGKANQFVGKLATSWTEQSINEPSPEGLTWIKRWTFTIRSGVKFHDGTYMTPQDVEYSFERLLVQDRTGGPSWMLFEPLLGVDGAVSWESDPEYGDKINSAIQSNATAVWFNLVKRHPSEAFKQIFSQPWSAVVKKDWAVAKGDFDGDWNEYWMTIWEKWHDPFPSFIQNEDPVGTGPYKLEYWVQGSYLSLVRFVDYWDGWPAWKDEARTERLVDYLNRVTWNYMGEWVNRRSRFWAGDSDMTYVDRLFREQVLGEDGIRCYYYWPPPAGEEGYLTLSLSALFFNFDVEPTSPNQYLGPGFDPADPYVIAEDRIPVNLFSDINVRRGFAYAFNYSASLDFSEGEQPSDPIIKGVSYDNPNQVKYYMARPLAEHYLRLAWGGDLWNNGMSFKIVYPVNNNDLEQVACIMRDSINVLQPDKFHVSVCGQTWPRLFLEDMVSGWLPLFIMDYQAGFRDPHSFIQPFMYHMGVFARAQNYSSPYADMKIKQAIITEDGMDRQQLYYELQARYWEDIPSLPIVQHAGRVFEREWMRGWYSNPLYQGGYFYHRWKAKTHFGDANNDGMVDVADGGWISAHWTKPGPGSPLGPLGYNPAADLTGGIGGTTRSEYGLIRGIPDGKVSVVDAMMVSAYWDGPPEGPLHP